ncbi:unnamed protein product, partial [Rotaria sordida]
MLLRSLLHGAGRYTARSSFRNATTALQTTPTITFDQTLLNV